MENSSTGAGFQAENALEAAPVLEFAVIALRETAHQSLNL